MRPTPTQFAYGKYGPSLIAAHRPRMRKRPNNAVSRGFFTGNSSTVMRLAELGLISQVNDCLTRVAGRSEGFRAVVPDACPGLGCGEQVAFTAIVFPTPD